MIRSARVNSQFFMQQLSGMTRLSRLTRFSRLVVVRGLAFLLAGSLASQAFAEKNYSNFDLDSAPSGTYEVDKTHAYVTFTYSHQGYSKPWLRFRALDATLDLDSDGLEQSDLSVVIDAASIDSGVDIFDEHLRGKNFFKVDKFPQISFQSTEIKQQDGNILITGNLKMLETEKPITLVATFNRGGLHFKSKKPMMGFSATTQLIRSEWGLGYAVPLVGDEVDVVIEVEFNRKHPLPSGVR